ncbi:YesL family protein [Ammoniphilus resinae]|uniref:Membrane protein YesL n=1 Tax=Ammoniphilus resinae TaxID=861532 RepID=A0ABS4GSR1_9BACL|nr:YesL family protein [Ammoniphilus resinae]MBP1933301.1 putative membrane protein YesL [Ammoniphilus resinae]
MELRGILGVIYHFCEWVMKLTYVNFLFIIFTLLGGVVLGAAPATTSMYTVIRKWIMGNPHIPIFTTFWHAYRRDFFQANLIGFILLILGFILYLDIKFAVIFKSMIWNFFIIVFLCLYGLILLYIFPIFVHYELKIIQYFKNAFFIAFSQPIMTTLMIASLYLVYLLFTILPGLLPFIGGSLISFVLMKLASITFLKVGRYQE